MHFRTHKLKSALIAGLIILAVPAAAQNYPTRPITVVVPFPGGAAADLLPRLTIDGMAADLGQPFVIDNRAGAAGTIGTNAVARAEPDGYTLLMTVNPPIVLNMYLQKNVPYDPRTALAPISLVAESPILVAVNPNLPVKNISELVAYAKQNPGKLSYGTPGIGTGQHILGELIKKRADIDMVHVPYRGTALMMQDVISGVIQLGMGTPSAVMPLATAGSLRVIAVAEPKRFPDLPEIPTIGETISGIEFNAWYGLFAPAGTPKTIVDLLNKSILKQLKNPDVVTKLRQQGIIAVGTSPEQLDKVVRADIARWAVEIPLIGIAPQ